MPNGSVYGALGSALGDPRASNPTLDMLRAQMLRAPPPGPMGPMPSAEDIQRHLAMTGTQYPQLPAVNPAAWNARFGPQGSAPMSRNVQDRRLLNAFYLRALGGGGGAL